MLIGAFGVGAVAASLLPADAPSADGPRAEGPRRPSRTIPVALLLFAAGLVAFGLAPRLGLAVAALPLAGFGYLLAQTRATTELQLSVADAERGRVMALWSVAFLGTRPFASLADGALANVIGSRPTVLVFAVPALAAAAVLTARRKAGPG